MTNTTNLVKKAFSVAVAATTILWSVGLSAFLPVAASAATFGDLIKGTTLSTVYYYGSDGQRYAFPNEKTYFSWNKDFSAVKTISDAQLASITLAGNIAYRPGARWIKITSDKKVYVVSTSGKIRWVESEAVAKGLGGDNWNAHIDDVPDVFFVDYTVGDSLTSAVSGYDGMLWSDGTTKYLVAGGKFQKVTDAGFAANGYNAGFVLTGTGFTKSGLTAGTDITAAMSNLTDAAQKVTTPTYAVSQNVSVALSASSPASSTLVGGQAIGNVMALDFTNPTSAPVSVKSLKLARTGVSADSTLVNTYLFSGYTRLTDSATVSSGVLSWNDAAGMFTIPAGGTVTINVRSDIASVSGQTLGLKLVSASDVGFVGAFAAAGTFPIMSAIHTTASASMATAYFGTTPTPSSDTAPAPQSDLKLWEDNLTVGGTNGASLYALRFRNTGSINAADVKNWRLYVAGTQRGAAVASQDANGYISFDLSAAPVKLTTNTHTVKLVADVIGGSSRTVSIGLRSAADAVIVDADYQQPILVTITNTTTAFSSRNANAQTIAQGDLTFSKRSDSPSTDVVLSASGASLARYDVKASGEPMKVESLNFNFIQDADADSAYALRNGAIYADGNQIGNTTALCMNNNTTAAVCTNTSSNGSDGSSYTTFNFGSSLVVYPGTPVLLEVKADVYDSVGNNSIVANDTIQVVIDGSSSNNVLRKVTGTYGSFPASDVPAGILTVKSGALTVSKNTSYAGQSFVAPKTAYKIGSYSLTSSSAESLNLTGFTVDLDASSGAQAGEISNLYVMYGTAGNMTTLATKATPSLADAGNVFAVDKTLAPNTTMFVDVYADLQDQDTNDTIITSLVVGANSTTSGGGSVSQNGDAVAVAGQTIALANGTFTSALDGSTPVKQIAQASQTVTAAKYRFSAANDTYTIKELQLSIPSSAAISGVPASVEIWDGGTAPLGTAVFNQTSGDSVTNGAANITGLSIAVPANSYKILTAKLVLNDVGFGAGTSQTNTALSLDVVKAYNSSGTLYTTAAGYTDDRDGNELYVFKSIPTVNQVDLTNSTVINGQATDLYKFTVTAGSNGSISLKQFKLAVNWSDGQTADSMELESLKFFKNGSDITSSVTMSDEDGNDATGTDGLLNKVGAVVDNTLVTTFTDEDSIGAGETVTYVVRGTPQGFRMTGSDTVADSVSLYLAGDAASNGSDTFLNDEYDIASGQVNIAELWSSAAAHSADGMAANFIWSDVSAQSHVGSMNAASTGDWHNGYKVLNLDLGSETWTK
ncbi:MAG: hypothetical protein NTX72_02355 [Candidatus Uhrbacteria bacterium]|nr:hypothetical protein [Candidatus Uhrbacteria bacterium]